MTVKFPKKIPKEVIRVSPSRLAAWMDCRERAALMRLGWQLKKPKVATSFGELMHDLTEHFIRPRLGKSLRGFAPSNLAVARVADQWTKKRIPLCDEKLLAKLETNAAYAEAMLPEYFRYWGRKPAKREITFTELEKPYKRLFKLARPVCGISKVLLIGRQDAQCMIGQRPYVMERKTGQRLDEREWSDLVPIRLQGKMYVYVKWVALGKPRTPPGLIYDFIRTPSIRPRKKEKTNEFLSRLRADCADRPDFYFGRISQEFTLEELEAFEDQWRLTLLEYVRWYIGLSPNYRNESGSACIGQWRCDFLSYCTGCEPIESLPNFINRYQKEVKK